MTAPQDPCEVCSGYCVATDPKLTHPANLNATTYAIGTPGHSWQLVAQGKATVAHKNMAHAAKIVASTAVDLLQHPELIEQAKAERRARLDGVEFINPIPEGVAPPFPDND